LKNYLAKRKTAIIIGLAVMLITCIPYLVGYGYQGSEWRFTGFVLGVVDGNSYVAKMLTGANGDWLFRSPYSAEHQKGALVFLPYLILGKLTSGPAQHEQLVAIFHIYRVAAGLMAAIASYDFLSLFIKKERHRLWALTVIMVGGGLGWIMAAAGLKDFQGSVPLDFISPESFGFLGLFALPHLSMARALILWGAAAYLRNETGCRAGLIWFLVGFFQPMFIPIVWVVISAYTLAGSLITKYGNRIKLKDYGIKAAPIKKALIAIILSSPLVIYTAVAFITDPYLSNWTVQNTLPSPHWLHYLIAYGIVLPFSVLGIYKLRDVYPEGGLFLSCWLAALPFLVSAPVSTQRRLAEGIWVLLVTGMFVYWNDKNDIPNYGKIVIGLLTPTTLFLLWGAIERAAMPSLPIFRPAEEVTAFLTINEFVSERAVILSAPETGNALPAWAHARVVFGHGPETVNKQAWQEEVEGYFMETKGKRECGNFFEEKGIDFLFWGPEEMEKWSWDPGEKDCMRQVYNGNGYEIYQIAK